MISDRLYHVLKGLLSPINEREPEVLLLEKLSARCQENGVTEIINALSATVEGQTTDYYIRNFFKDRNIKVSALAPGIPMGRERGYLTMAHYSPHFRQENEFEKDLISKLLKIFVLIYFLKIFYIIFRGLLINFEHNDFE